MASPAFWEESRRAQAVLQERSDLARSVGQWREFAKEIEEVREWLDLLAKEGEAGEVEAALGDVQGQLEELRRKLAEFELKVILSGPHDGKTAILSIHPGAGGTESQDWAQMLMRLYLRWAERAGFRAEVVDLLPGDEAGVKSCTITIGGNMPTAI